MSKEKLILMLECVILQSMALIVADTVQERINQVLKDTNPGASQLTRCLWQITRNLWTGIGVAAVHTITNGTSYSRVANLTLYA